MPEIKNTDCNVNNTVKQFIIKIVDNDVYVNDRLCSFDNKMDEDPVDDLNKKAILALANEMGYEPVYLFEEIANRLDEMLEEI